MSENDQADEMNEPQEEGFVKTTAQNYGTSYGMSI